MTVKACLIGKAVAGGVNFEKAERIAERFDDMVREGEIDLRLSRHEAEREAAKRLQAQIERQANRRRRMALKQAIVEDRVRQRAAQFPDRVPEAMLSFLEFDPKGIIAGESMAQRIQVVRGEAHAQIVDFLDTFRSKAAGFRRKLSGLDDIVRELFGEDTGIAEAKAFAGALTRAIDHLRGRFNAAGGDVIRRRGWGWFQSHDRGAIAAASKDDWLRFTFDRLDPAGMLDASGQPMSVRHLMASLGELYDSIVTGGLSDLGKTDPLEGSVVTARTRARFLVFRSADAWLEYQKRFGQSDFFTSVVGQIDAYARDVAEIEVLGPHSQATLALMEDLIDKSTAQRALSATGRTAAKLSQAIGGPKGHLRDTYNVVTGRLNVPENGPVAEISQANRNVVTSALLGGAWLSSLSDIAVSRLTAKMNGMPVAKLLARQLKLFVPGRDGDRRLAIRLGFTAEGWASQAIAAERYLGEVIGPQWTSRLADTVLRLGWLSPWTQAGRWAFRTELLGFITANAGRKVGKLPEPMRNMFARHGITPADWELIRSTPLWRDPETGAEFLRAEDVARHRNPSEAPDAGRQRFDAANKLQHAIFTESEFAIVSTTNRVRALLTAGRPAGTFWGEIARNTALFKGFPVTVLHLHLSRGLNLEGAKRWHYLASLIIGTTVLGVLGDQLSEISKGKDPQDLTDPAVWAKGAARGGGLGLLGDFLFSNVNRYGGGIVQSLAGPIAGTQLTHLTDLTLGNVQELIREGRMRDPGRDVAEFAEFSAPGHSLWYLRLAAERAIFDQIETALDPDYAEHFRMVEQRARREFGQRYWWRPGHLAPERGPDLSAAGGE